MQVSQAIEGRHSCRAFLDRPVSRSTLERLMELTCRAPSAINLQPWLFTVVMGPEVARLGRRLLKAHAERDLGCKPDNVKPMPQIYRDRQAELNRAMRPLLQEAGVDMAGFINQGSLTFYGAPAVVVASLDQTFAARRSLDLGLALGWLLLAARELGLDTCPIGLICPYADHVVDFLNLPQGQEVLLAVALGYGDPDSPLNRLRTSRAPLAEVVRWY